MHISFYEDYIKKIKDKGVRFDLSKTTYSRKVKQKGLTILFNEDGDSDMDALGLINLVRKNAKDFLGNTSFKQRSEYIYFSELINKPKSQEIIYKIDVRSAYWIAAMKRGVIEETTNSKLLEVFEFKTPEEMKRTRLKALGSLATKKTEQEWLGRKLLKEKVVIENTKDLYMDICRDVDNLMRECVDENQQIVFYYWDCIFVPSGFEMEVMEFFKNRKYDVSVGTTRLEYINIGRTNWVLSQDDDKAYMVKKESRGLIDF